MQTMAMRLLPRQHAMVAVSPAQQRSSAGRTCFFGQRSSSRQTLTAAFACRNEAGTGAEALLPRQQQQQRLTADAAAVAPYIQGRPALLRALGTSSAAELQCNEMLDGVINVLVAVRGPSGGIVLKQALPYVRSVGESFPLSRERMDVEAAATAVVAVACPGLVPAVLDYDQEWSVLAMQLLPPPHAKLLVPLQRGETLPGLAHQLGHLLSSYLGATSTDLLPADFAVLAAAKFKNADIVAANERVVLAGPFDPADDSNNWPPQLDADVLQIWDDVEVRAAVDSLLLKYRTNKQALIHNDLHAGNLLVAPGSLFCIDWEFATLGPVAFDVGCLLGNLVLCMLWLQALDEVEASERSSKQQQQQQRGSTRQQQAAWLLEVLKETWELFVVEYPQRRAAAAAPAGSGCGMSSACELWAQVLDGERAATGLPPLPAPTLPDDWQQQLLLDSAGYAGCCLVRLTIGMHKHPALQAVPCDEARAAAQLRCLRLGRALLRLSRSRDSSIDALVSLVTDACGGWLNSG